MGLLQLLSLLHYNDFSWFFYVSEFALNFSEVLHLCSLMKHLLRECLLNDFFGSFKLLIHRLYAFTHLANTLIELRKSPWFFLSHKGLGQLELA